MKLVRTQIDGFMSLKSIASARGHGTLMNLRLDCPQFVLGGEKIRKKKKTKKKIREKYNYDAMHSMMYLLRIVRQPKN